MLQNHGGHRLFVDAPVWYGDKWTPKSIGEFFEVIHPDDPSFGTYPIELIGWSETTRKRLSRRLSEGQRWGDDLVAFAGTSGGGSFCLDYRTDRDDPPVLYADFDGPAGEVPLHFAAPSINDFIMMADYDGENDGEDEIDDSFTKLAKAWTSKRDSVMRSAWSPLAV